MGVVITPVPFSHNHLHDLESLWWVAVWMVLYNDFSKPKKDDNPALEREELQQQLILAQDYFPFALKSGSRILGFQTSFKKACVKLPSNKQSMCAYLEGIRAILIGQYKIVESTLPGSIDLNSSTDQIYETFKGIFAASKRAHPDYALKFIPKIYTELLDRVSEKQGEKRLRSESTNDAGVVAQKAPRMK
jgi:hypothetical protein